MKLYIFSIKIIFFKMDNNISKGYLCFYLKKEPFSFFVSFSLVSYCHVYPDQENNDKGKFF